MECDFNSVNGGTGAKNARPDGTIDGTPMEFNIESAVLKLTLQPAQTLCIKRKPHANIIDA